MKINILKETPIKETPHKINAKLLYDKSEAQAIHLELASGESLIPHITAVDVFFYVLEGSPEILVGDEKRTVYADSLVESPKNIPHCISNNSDKIARILVVKTPRTNKKSKFL
ncbi:MAG: cupin [Bacteroidetes bacterium 4572_128]|nr:MAG: cupin [Bacteroidetes bacterium 4572_128]